ncbi:MAG: VanZ family protein [Pirellulales bacterium]|nr:VanZ family protein [Pirellulales bacterium]
MSDTVPLYRSRAAGSWGERPYAAVATIALFAYVAALALGTHLPPASVSFVTVNDKVCHFVAYFGLGAIVWFALAARRRVSTRAAWLIWAVVAVCGVIDESTQPWFGRSFELYDLLADCSGAAVSVSLLQLGDRWRRRRRSAAIDSAPTPLIIPRRRQAA